LSNAQKGEVSMRVLSVFLLAGAALAQGPAYKEVANNHQLMDGLIRPMQMAIGNAAKEAPADDRAWRGIVTNAIMLQESAQMLKTSGRAKDQDGWMKAADNLGAAGASVQKAAEAKDFEALKTASAGIGGACQGCHRVYRQPAASKKQ
jgi:cytochrome c556